MRLGQLARKLDLRPAEIVEFLATKNIVIEDDVNAKVDKNQAALVFRQFAHDEDAEIIPDADIPTVAIQVDVHADMGAPDAAEVSAGNQSQPERNEVIKAPKIELSGLKVLGKIDLPEAKKKQADADGSQEKTEPELRSQEFKGERRSPQNSKKTQRHTKNPIALQREREALAAQKKREEELQLKKEKRTQNYLKKVKAHQPTKAAKLIREEAEEMSASELEESPKSWWGKFIKWFTSQRSS